MSLLHAMLTLVTGKTIGEEDMFKYTSGRFLINEEHQCQQRYIKFDIPQLCAVAATAGASASPVMSIEKMEGGFCKALLMRKADGTEVVAKLPSKLAGPPSYSTASEVAPGVQLYKKWGDMDGTSRLELTKHLGNLESELATIHFPASGSLYLRGSSVPKGSWNLPDSIDPSQSYCIGPSMERSWNKTTGARTCEPGISAGPWTSLSEYGINIAKREISRIPTSAKDTRPYNRNRCADREIADLTKATTVFKILESQHPELASISKPILWHTDLHSGNIFVSEQDPTQIVSIIDWQFISAGPLFLQVNWPDFLKPNDEYIYGVVQPQLPDDFETLDEAEKKLAISDRNDAIVTKSYEIRSALHCKDVYRSLNLPSVFLETFIRCGEASAEGTIGLRACLAELYKSWDSLGFTGECPLSFTDDELQVIEAEFKEYRDWHDVQELAKRYLETDADGWISPELDFAEIQQRNRAVIKRYVKEMSKHMPPEAALEMWPF
ncbi:protein kinase subdomain-containing protein [Nannizzia gypsea CBS 118893]|uniref:Altered inheritance of mitochondria protein 9, mitochondrial n=1 Tax=Arthroderma gypseum (strain ATCC MYA-4604 / CBS 118893) TaxID=535722 RepID=E4V2E3_ARTGP|nr:protein kinase subdomain-containing protein [Nannizzia gypsea CBS 118893]EFR04208.1 protein kinase subdomain-containing protein [Nannizzia gypsea CBS 118893]